MVDLWHHRLLRGSLSATVVLGARGLAQPFPPYRQCSASLAPLET